VINIRLMDRRRERPRCLSRGSDVGAIVQRGSDTYLAAVGPADVGQNIGRQPGLAGGSRAAARMSQSGVARSPLDPAPDEAGKEQAAW
jgi:hypothetical protein